MKSLKPVISIKHKSLLYVVIFLSLLLQNSAKGGGRAGTIFPTASWVPYKFYAQGQILVYDHIIISGRPQYALNWYGSVLSTTRANISHSIGSYYLGYPFYVTIPANASIVANAWLNHVYVNAQSNTPNAIAQKTEQTESTTDTSATVNVDSSNTIGWTSTTNFQISSFNASLIVNNNSANAKLKITVWTPSNDSDTLVTSDKTIWYAWAQIFDNTLNYSSNFIAGDFTSSSYNSGAGLEVDLINVLKNITVPSDYFTSNGIAVTVEVGANDTSAYSGGGGGANPLTGINLPNGANNKPSIYNNNLHLNNVNSEEINANLYDINGKLLSKLYNGIATPSLTLQLNDGGLAPGLYLVGILTNKEYYTTKFVVQ